MILQPYDISPIVSLARNIDVYLQSGYFHSICLFSGIW